MLRSTATNFGNHLLDDLLAKPVGQLLEARSLSQVLCRLPDICGIRHLGRDLARRRVTDVDARVVVGQGRRIEPGVTARGRRHFAQSHMGQIIRSCRLLAYGTDVAIDRPIVHQRGQI